MKEKRNIILTILGVIYILYWLLDFIFNAVLTNDYTWLLWYSSAGLLITGITLLIQNTKLTYSMFCALFVIETLWIVDLFYVVFRQDTLLGFTQYMLSGTFNLKDFYLTLYHVLIPIGLFIAVFQTKKIYTYGWVGAVIFATLLAVLTYLLTDPSSQVNCISSINQCVTAFSFLYRIDNPYRIILSLIGLTGFVFIPTNYLLIIWKKKTVSY